jgi:hypothetical protein
MHGFADVRVVFTISYAEDVPGENGPFSNQACNQQPSMI